MTAISSTQQALLDSGKKLFLDKGFKSAPLRKIVEGAGFTLGAFYGYYKTKEDLFYALTDETADGFTGILLSISQEMDKLPAEEKLYHMVDCYLERLPELVEFICSHKEEMTLLIRCADGTKYENFLGSFQEKSENKITGATKLANQSGKDMGAFDKPTFDLLMTGYFNMLGTVMLSEADPDRIRQMMSDIAIVYKEGMIRLLEIKKS